MAVDSTSGARPPRQARRLAAKLTERGGGHGEAVMVASGGGVSALARGSGHQRWWRRGPTSPGKGEVSEAHGKMAKGRSRAALTGEAESMAMLHRDLGAAATPGRPERTRSKGGGGGGGECSQRAPCEEKGGVWKKKFGSAAAGAF
jgi:hypothetical protein